MTTMITMTPKLINMGYSFGVCGGLRGGCLTRLSRAGGRAGGAWGRVAGANRGSAASATW